ncbi:hypothetical protein ARUE_c33160 [Arthrobacter sp. Rue61a]|nr:hypothetical protein ARUE_c33160 [Arthrobacter sp. Rue61a]
MSARSGKKPESTKTASAKSARAKTRRRRRFAIAGGLTAFILIAAVSAAAWLGSRAELIKSELTAATKLLPTLKTQIASADAEGASRTVEALTAHTGSARSAAGDPLWKVAAVLPWIGPNLQAASEVSSAADDVARLGAAPLVKVFRSLDWNTLTPSSAGIDLAPLKAAAPSVQSAAHAVRESAQRLNRIDESTLLPQISDPLVSARNELTGLSKGLDSASDAANLAPAMMGADTPRRYLLLFQNNAESRATGGIPGALAVLSVDKGKLSLGSQTTAGQLGAFLPPISVDGEQQAIYSARMGKFMQDVNLTPDFATTASTAQTMWEKKNGERLDGVLSIDPVALSFILDATGPVELTQALTQQFGDDLPSELTSKNVVPTLLSDAYAKIQNPNLQDVYFAGAAAEIFAAISDGRSDPKNLMEAISKGIDERRILLWSGSKDEQATIGKYSIGGLVSGSSVVPTQFGVYFNDGTGAKMDYWIKRNVQVVRDCTRDGYREVALSVTSTNTAPEDAAVSLPEYVTGGGVFGVPAGTVQTNIVAYGPAQANVDTVVKDGLQIPFAAQRHGQRAVGTSTIKLAPGESTTLIFNFGHIVQHSEPQLVVTPTTQLVKDVIKTPVASSCE